MRLPNLLLTDSYISEIKCPANKSHIEVFDSDLRGFYVDVMASGRKSFRLRYRAEKKLRVITLGDAQILSVDEARRQALKCLKQFKQSVNSQELPFGDEGPSVESFFLPQIFAFCKKLQTQLGHR